MKAAMMIAHTVTIPCSCHKWYSSCNGNMNFLLTLLAVVGGMLFLWKGVVK